MVIDPSLIPRECEPRFEVELNEVGRVEREVLFAKIMQA